MPRKRRFPAYPAINKFYYDRHGKPHYYIDGVALKNPGPFGSDQFRAEYERVVLSSSSAQHDSAPRLGALPGSFRAICEAFIQATFAPDPKNRHAARTPAAAGVDVGGGVE